MRPGKIPTSQPDTERELELTARCCNPAREVMINKAWESDVSLAVDDDGNVYVSLINGANFAAEGQVRRFTIP